MIETELWDFIKTIQQRGSEEQTTEVKAAHHGCPEKLYDTISAFSNQDSGGIILFGLDERKKFAKVGVYDAHDLQKKVMEYCEQMTPLERPVFTVCEEDGMEFVAAELTPEYIAARPCMKTAKGRMQGSYIRVGDADKPMTEYEVYSYEAFRRKYRDDIRPAEGGPAFTALDEVKVGEYLARTRNRRPNLARTTEAQQYELTGIMRDGKVTMAAVLLFGLYPQAYCPRLCIAATCMAGREKGIPDVDGNRFIDTKRIEGTLSEMLDEALNFVRKNTRTATKFDMMTGERIDVPQYPTVAVREAVLNALIHRDYSIHTEGMPIQLDIYSDRMEIINPGGLYGRLTVDQLGFVQADSRNPVLATAMELLEKTENRYSGIPTIRHAMQRQGLPEPVFADVRGTFKVTLYHHQYEEEEDDEIFMFHEEPAIYQDYQKGNAPQAKKKAVYRDEKGLIEFCREPRTREEVIKFLGVPSAQYALRRYLDPLLKAGAILMSIPEKPRSPKQTYVTAKEVL